MLGRGRCSKLYSQLGSVLNNLDKGGFSLSLRELHAESWEGELTESVKSGLEPINCKFILSQMSLKGRVDRQTDTDSHSLNSRRSKKSHFFLFHNCVIWAELRLTESSPRKCSSDTPGQQHLAHNFARIVVNWSRVDPQSCNKLQWEFCLNYFHLCNLWLRWLGG